MSSPRGNSKPSIQLWGSLRELKKPFRHLGPKTRRAPLCGSLTAVASDGRSENADKSHVGRSAGVGVALGQHCAAWSSSSSTVPPCRSECHGPMAVVLELTLHRHKPGVRQKPGPRRDRGAGLEGRNWGRGLNKSHPKADLGCLPARCGAKTAGNRNSARKCGTTAVNGRTWRARG